MRQPSASRDWIPVAPSWERNPDDTDLWRRVPTLPSLALNRAECELLGEIAGRRVCVLGVGDGLAPLALAALGARPTVIDPAHTLLDLLMVRCRITGLELDFLPLELSNLSSLRPDSFDLAYAAQTTTQLTDLGRFYAEIHHVLVSGGRLIINEYHPLRRIWKQEPGSPRLARSYFQRWCEPEEDSIGTGNVLGRRECYWTVSDHVHFLLRAGFRLSALEEVGEVRQHWEIPNLRGLPEQLILAADKT